MKTAFEFGYSRRSFLCSSAALGMGAMFSSRLWADEPHPVPAPYNKLSDKDEIELGQVIAEAIEKEMQIIKFGPVDSYLNGIVKELAAVSQRPDLPYYCKFVNTDVINAVSIPGGGIYLNRGLVQFIDKEDELVATLAHEVGHVVARHSANKIMLQSEAQKAYALVKDRILSYNQMLAELIEKLGGALAVLALLQFSRENELEADKLGLYEMARAGYQPMGMMELFQSFADLEDKSSLPSPFLRSHPPAKVREEAIRPELALVKVADGAKEDSLAFQAFRLALNLLPPAPQPAAKQPEKADK